MATLPHSLLGNLYGWSCDHEDVVELAKQVSDWSDWDAYPKSWPRPDKLSKPLSIVPFSQRIKSFANRRKAATRKDLDSAGPYYPRDEVKRVLDY